MSYNHLPRVVPPSFLGLISSFSFLPFLFMPSFFSNLHSSLSSILFLCLLFLFCTLSFVIPSATVGLNKFLRNFNVYYHKIGGGLFDSFIVLVSSCRCSAPQASACSMRLPPYLVLEAERPPQRGSRSPGSRRMSSRSLRSPGRWRPIGLLAACRLPCPPARESPTGSVEGQTRGGGGRGHASPKTHAKIKK